MRHTSNMVRCDVPGRMTDIWWRLRLRLSTRNAHASDTLELANYRQQIAMPSALRTAYSDAGNLADQ
jgi:hypothetical protein